MQPDPSSLLDRLTALGDLARLRILRLLEREELSVGELARAVQLPQSTVSRHLKVLHDRSWIVRRTEGTASLYRLVRESLGAEALAMWDLVRRQLGSSPTLEEDEHRLAVVLAERRGDSRTFFGQIGAEWDRLRAELFGDRFTTDALLALLAPSWTVADLGCGTGEVAELVAPHVRKMIAIDREPAMLEAARRRLSRFENVEFREGDLARLPLDDGEVDAALVFLVMHHVAEPALAIAEIARVLAPAGVALLVDMVAHDRASYRVTMGHEHLGFEPAKVREWANAAGLTVSRIRRLAPDTRAKGPGLFLATLVKY
jgi:ArsR family transcriptional regulator